MRTCYEEVSRFSGYCGLRNPSRAEANALLEHLKALAALTRVPGAEQLVAPPIRSHST